MTKQTQFPITTIDPVVYKGNPARSVDLGGRVHTSLSHYRFVARQIRGFLTGCARSTSREKLGGPGY